MGSFVSFFVSLKRKISTDEWRRHPHFRVFDVFPRKETKIPITFTINSHSLFGVAAPRELNILHSRNRPKNILRCSVICWPSCVHFFSFCLPYKEVIPNRHHRRPDETSFWTTSCSDSSRENETHREPTKPKKIWAKQYGSWNTIGPKTRGMQSQLWQ